jgi:hypothetical protein
VRVVADKLYTIALEEDDVEHFDRFGRSAFNRYYYACYLETRGMLADLNPGWAKATHANIPDILRMINKTFAAVIKKQQGRTLTWSDAKNLKQELNRSTSDLAQLLEAAYAIRCIADYQPELAIIRKGSILELQQHSIHEAKNWPARAAACAKDIRKVWNELGRP